MAKIIVIVVILVVLWASFNPFGGLLVQVTFTRRACLPDLDGYDLKLHLTGDIIYVLQSFLPHESRPILRSLRHVKHIDDVKRISFRS